MDEQFEVMLSRTLSWLKSTRYVTTSLVPLPGGEVNFTFLAHLQDAPKDGTKEVVVKHSEDFVRHVPEFKVSLLRVVRTRNEQPSLSSLLTANDSALSLNVSAAFPR